MMGIVYIIFAVGERELAGESLYPQETDETRQPFYLF
jgi:hypothetical protein